MIDVKKFVKLFGLGLSILFGFFVLWMNVTPGHFRTWCDCDQVLYIDVRGKIFKPCGLPKINCQQTLVQKLQLLMANLDFNK